LIEVLESGEMPKKGQKLTKQEIAAIAKWIDEGAKFDGTDPMVQLTRFASATTTKSQEPKLNIAKPSGKETVQFSKDIAPVLVANCIVCHGAMQNSGQLRMDNFAALNRGGQSGNVWKPGDPAESLIIKKLKGTAGARMPLKKPALPDEVIAKFEKWISEGATFDGANPNQSTQMLATLTRAKLATHEELSADRREEAAHKWRLAAPSDKPISKETKNFFIIGSVTPAVLDEAAEAAEAQAAAVAKYTRAPSDKPLVKGRITLFLLPSRYQYSEFGQMVEQRQLPADWRGHWKFDIIDAYAVVVPPSGSPDYSLAGIIGQQTAAVYVASLSPSVPGWFAEGTGRNFAAHADGRAARIHQWNDRLAELLAPGGRIEGFLKDRLAPPDNGVAAYGFVKDLMAASAKYNSLISALRGGEDFEASFTRIFGSSPQQVVANWSKSPKAL
jgi:mono/diheme cytochrome c family protein